MSERVAIDLATGNPGGEVLAVRAGGDTLNVEFVSLYSQAPPVPQFTDADYAAAFKALMPRGRAWPDDPASVQQILLGALAKTFTRVNAVAAALIQDGFPTTTVGLLPEWEETLGLPDPCAGLAPTLQQRQDQVVAKFVNTGGQSVPYFVNLALSLGYVITITEFGSANPHHWQVNAPTITEQFFRTGSGAAGDPLVLVNNDVLECVFNELKPAHTTLSFHYGP